MRGKTGLQAATWTAAVLLAVASPGSYPSQGEPPNLRPFQPPGWSDAIVVSNRQGDNIDSQVLQASDRLYVDFAVINAGGSPVSAPFRINLYVDGRLIQTFDVPSPLDPQAYRFREDYPIGRWGTGTHTLRIVADAGDSVAESDESDNEYTRTIIVGGGCFPLAATVLPRGGGTLAPNRDPNCGEATVSINGRPAGGGVPGGALKLGGEPVVRARRSRALAALGAKARLEDRVRVIVGLRTGLRSAVASVGGLQEARTRSPLIARTQQSLLVRMSGHGITLIRRFKFIPYVAMEVDKAGLEALSSDPEVVSIEEDRTVEPVLADSTSLIGAPDAWSQGFSGSGQAVAILDTGVDKHHPFLSGKVVSEACYSGGGDAEQSFCPGGVTESTTPGSGMPCPPDFSGCFHGTAVAGVAAGDGPDFSGVARDAHIIAIQVFSRCGEDCTTSTTSDWVAGLERVLELSADFDIAAANMSFGGALYKGVCDAASPAAKAAMDNLGAAGIASVVASANNSSSTEITFPACISSAVSVGSTDGIGDGTTREVVSDFSNSSPLLDLLAPGRQIQTPVPGNGFDRFNGTSLATSHVSGAWAVLKSKAPNATAPELLSLLSRTGFPIADSRNGLIKPRIQVDAALNAVIPELSYSSGTRLTLTAAPNPGFRFILWRGCDDSSGNRCFVEMNAAKEVTAVFEPLGDAADLLTTSLTAPGVAAAGKEVAIAATIRNGGSADAGPFRLGFYLSEDPDISLDDTWFAACAYEAGLAAGRSATCRRPFPIPHRIVPGRYTLGAIVDDLDRVAEKSETNNALVAGSGPLEVLPPPRPDLVTTSLMGPPTAAVGTEASISASIRNQGPANAGPFRLGLYLSADTTITTDDTWFAACSYDAGLQAGESETCSGSFPIPPQVSPGRYFLGAIVDDLDRVAEKSETNNALVAGSGPLEVLPPPRPDLVTTSLMGPPTAAVGTEASISASIRNQGPANAGPFRLGLYLSADTTITTDDTWFAACSYDAGLQAGESETCSGSFPIPPQVSPGRYFLGAIVDDLDRVAENNETNNARVADSGPLDVLATRMISRSFVPVLLTAEGRRGSFFTSELTLTNRGSQEARLDYAYTAHAGGGSGTAFDLLAPGEQQIEPDALGYLQRLGIPIPASGNRIGTLEVEALATEEVGVLVRTTTLVPEGRAGLAYPGIATEAGFHELVYLCGLRQNSRDRSNVALQHMGTTEDGPITLYAWVHSGENASAFLKEVKLEPGGFRQFSGVLSEHQYPHGYVEVRRASGTAPFYAYGVINDNFNSDGSFVFPVRKHSLEGKRGQTLPVIVETRDFSSELTVTNVSGETKTLHFSFVADRLTTTDRTSRFSLTIGVGEQQIIPDVIDTEMRRKGVDGVPLGRGGLAGALFATVESGDMSGIVIGARTGTPDGRGGQYGVFYNAVPDGAAFTGSAWVDGLQQNAENRSNLALVNTGEVDDTESVFDLDIYDGDTGLLVRTVATKPLPARRWRQINAILADHAPGTTQGYIRVRQVSGNNPFLAYGVVNDGGAPGQRSGDGAYVPARE